MDGSDEYQNDGSSSDDEETLIAAEQEFGAVKEEAEALQMAADAPLDEVMQDYQRGAGSADTLKTEGDAERKEGGAAEEELGLEYLLRAPGSKEEGSKGNDSIISRAAADALSAQPSGFTLATTSVKTAVPFLLKHTLREYQHIGLDWLVAMYDKQLNGILADEMGLGKTIMSISLLAYLACERGIWGPHLVVVPTSVLMNWEKELKKWCPAFKVLTYYGGLKERKAKRQGWSKPNAFHVCVTSYKLVIQDAHVFKRKAWQYLILDEAQNIKNFKSQRWQVLLNFNTQRRLLLTGTPLQNNLMELWSLMHFLMPAIFQSHSEFKEWFSRPVAQMIEGDGDFNEDIINRLHGVLRPFLLRRLKRDVEKQLPGKFEHIVLCGLSKRQRFLYDDFMSRSSTKELLSSGGYLGVLCLPAQPALYSCPRRSRLVGFCRCHQLPDAAPQSVQSS